jgi:F0F1-type ATP synthase assembly protein I
LRKISQAGKFRGEMGEPEKDAKGREPAKPEWPPKSQLAGAGNAVAGASQFAGIGIQFAVAILLGLYGGQWLDRRWNTKPVFLLIGVFLGAAAGFMSMYRAVNRSSK